MIPGSVTIGGSSKSELLDALRDRGIRLNPATEALFADPRFTTRRERLVVEIAAVSVVELGLGEGATYRRLIARALESGVVECPLELGPHLRLQFPDQADSADGAPSTRGRAPPGSITIASSPLDESDETPRGFYLRRVDGIPWLRGYRSSHDHIWSPEDVFVFARRSANRRVGAADERRAREVQAG